MEEVRPTAMSGDEAVANALALVNPDVVPAYPITPQTIIMEHFSDYWADGKVDTEIVHVESEHSAMSAAIGASATGARVFTASSSQGVTLMFEVLPIASGSRLPIVMAVANRALSAPINIHGELTDQLITRDTGWISWIGEDAQEAYDHTILSFKVAEHKDVMLPLMYGLEGFIVTHAVERVMPLTKKFVLDFLGDRREFDWAFRPGYEGAQGLLALPDYYMELKYQQKIAMEHAAKIIPKVFEEFGEETGRYYKPVETYQMEDADYALVTMGATSGTARQLIDELRTKGEKVGLVKLRVYRPYPTKEIVNVLKDVKGAMVIDRSITFGSPGKIPYMDIATSFVTEQVTPPILSSMTVGLGGRNIAYEDLAGIYEVLKRDVANEKPSFEWWNVRI